MERGRYQDAGGIGPVPSIMVIGCVDSRVSPEVIFDAAPGEILVARNVANLVPRYEPPPRRRHQPAAWHQRGAGIRGAGPEGAAHRGAGPCLLRRHQGLCQEDAPLTASDFIGRWMSQIAPAAETIGPRHGRERDAYLRELEFASVDLSLKNLMTFPFVKAAVETGRTVPAWRLFRRRLGTAAGARRQTGKFEPVA